MWGGQKDRKPACGSSLDADIEGGRQQPPSHKTLGAVKGVTHGADAIQYKHRGYAMTQKQKRATGRPAVKDKIPTTTVAIPRDVHERLSEYARAHGRVIGPLYAEIINDFLKKQG